MTYINKEAMLIEEEVAGNLPNNHNSKIQDKKIWKSLRTHILSRREKNKQAEADAEVLRKKKCVEYQKMQENKLSLAQINGRLSQLRDKRDELEEEKRALLNQSQSNDDTTQATALVVPTIELNCELINNKSVVTNNISNAVISNHRSPALFPQHHLFKQQTTSNAQSGARSPAGGSPLAQQSLMMHNSSTSSPGSQTLLVCSPAAINAGITNNQNNIVTRSTPSLTAPLSSTMTFTKFSPLYSSSTTHLLAPNIGISNKMGRTPSPQSQPIQQQPYQPQQIVVPFPPPLNKYPPINSGGNSSNNVNSAATTSVANTSQSLSNATNSNYPSENSNRRGNREETSQIFNRNVWINNITNKIAQPIVSNYGSFYQPSSTAVNYCVNNGMSSSSQSLSSVNTVYSYSGPPPPPPPPPHPRTESSSNSNIMVSAANEHGAQQMTKPIPSHHPGPSHPPMYMSPGIRNQTSNHTYHNMKPSHNVYPDEKSVSTASSFFQPQNNRNVLTSSITTVTSQPHQMTQKMQNLGYPPMRHSTSATSVSQLSPAVIQSSQHSTYNVPASGTGYSTKTSTAVVSSADAPRYQQQPSPQTPISRHE